VSTDRDLKYENSAAGPELAETPVKLPDDEDKPTPTDEQAAINREDDPPA
jgi:hypothetical protein